MNKEEQMNNDLGHLPNWAKKIIIESDEVRYSAYWYRRELVAVRIALHDLCKDDARGLAFEDSVLKAKNKVHEALDRCMSKRDKAERIAVRKRVLADMEEYRTKVAEAVAGRGKAKKEVSR